MSDGEALEEVKQKIALSVDEELFWAAANLLQAEEHLLRTISESPPEFLDDLKHLVASIRSKRVKLMKMIGMSNPFGEVWCVAKHIISASYRVMEASEKCLVHIKDTHMARELSTVARELEELILLYYVRLIERMAKEGEKSEKMFTRS